MLKTNFSIILFFQKQNLDNNTTIYLINLEFKAIQHRENYFKNKVHDSRFSK